MSKNQKTNQQIKRQTIVYKHNIEKLKTEQFKPHQKLGIISGASKNKANASANVA